MDSMDVNKGIAAILIAGIAFFITGTIGTILVHTKPLDKPVLAIAIPEPGGAGKEAAKPVVLAAIAPLLVKADLALGESTAKKLCSQCHTFNEGGKNGVGPNLYGSVGQPHGHVAGFNYSTGLKGKTGPWTYEDLNNWLFKPSAYVTGTRMAFAGIKDDQSRANVIAYMRTLSKNPVPLPAP